MNSGVVANNPANIATNNGDVRPLSLDPSGALRTVSAAPTSSTATTDVSGTIGAAANVTPLAANTTCQLLIVSNTGGNPMMLRFGQAATASIGHPIAAGGSVVLDTKCPTGSLNLFSTSGTTYTVTAG